MGLWQYKVARKKTKYLSVSIKVIRTNNIIILYEHIKVRGAYSLITICLFHKVMSPKIQAHIRTNIIILYSYVFLRTNRDFVIL